MIYNMNSYGGLFSVPVRTQREPYNFEANFFGNIRLPELRKIIEKNTEACEQCLFHKKNHYCIQAKCAQKGLICPECDIDSIEQPHYMHDHTYILPLFSKDIFSNFYKLKHRVEAFHQDVRGEIGKIEQYLKELMKVEEIVIKQIDNLIEEEKTGKIRNYSEVIEKYLQDGHKNQKLGDILKNIEFMSAAQYSAKEQQIKVELISGLNSLNWPKDPQKVLKQKIKAPFDDSLKEIFISRFKTLEINEIDSYFKAHYQIFTQNMKNHEVKIDIESELITKSKFYESFIYHFKDCKYLALQNGNMNHLRTPLTFSNLKKLSFTFNCDNEPQNMKFQLLSDQLRSLTLRRFREEDLKLLKHITANCSHLREINLEFSNKIDLFSSKDLIDFLMQQKGKDLVTFTLKLRSQNEVKRQYGYLSKFYRQIGESNTNLNATLLQILDENPNLTKFVIQGVKTLDIGLTAQYLNKLPFLMNYEITYDGIDFTKQIEEEYPSLRQTCFKRKSIFYSCAKASKFKQYPKYIIQGIISDFLI